ncbi:MAG TPA: hypothetical protein VN578_20895 [Candidatus Binatia bacterium]|jgi:hypothetical protein|nr:hypothetical protein [Candidatus Binatia bacterium]
MAPEAKPRRPHGCLFYGCLIGTVCLGGVLLALLLGLYQVRKMIFQFTDSQPMPVPTLQMSPAEMEQVRHRFQDFLDALRLGRQTLPLALTGDDINAFIATDPDLRALKGKLYVTIEGDRLKGQLSLRLSDLGLPFFKGRYINGTGTFALSLQNSNLWLLPELITVKGKPLPSLYMNKIRRQNLAENVAANPRASSALDHLQSLELKDGKLLLIPKTPQEPAAEVK